MIGDDGDVVSGAHKEVAPVFEASNDGEELPIPDWVVPFGLRECFRIRTYHAPSSCVIGLIQDGTSGKLRGIYFQLKWSVLVWLPQNWCRGNDVNESV